MTPGTSLLRRMLGVLAVGLAGLSGLALQAASGALPLPEPLAQLPRAAAIALVLLNPLVLLVLASLAGAQLAHRVGLGSAVAGTAPWPPARTWAGSAALGLAAAAAIAGADALWQRATGGGWAPAAGPAAASLRQLAFGALYGGLVEEVLMRWGLVSLLAWGLHRLHGRRHPPATAVGVAVVLAALVFAIGHLPALAAGGALTPMLVARTVALNFGAALVYGWLFWRRGLEAAMAAHAATHLGFFAIALAVA